MSIYQPDSDPDVERTSGESRPIAPVTLAPEPHEATDHRSATVVPAGVPEGSATQRQTRSTQGHRSMVPLRRVVLEQLREYPRLEALVDAYVRAHEWRRVSKEIEQHLLARRTRVKSDDFWAGMDQFLQGDMIASPAKSDQAGSAAMNVLIDEFRVALEKVRTNVDRARNYYAEDRQELAADALSASRVMWGKAHALVGLCRDETSTLLRSLHSCVDEIFQAAEEAYEEEREVERAGVFPAQLSDTAKDPHIDVRRSGHAPRSGGIG